MAPFPGHGVLICKWLEILSGAQCNNQINLYIFVFDYWCTATSHFPFLPWTHQNNILFPRNESQINPISPEVVSY